MYTEKFYKFLRDLSGRDEIGHLYKTLFSLIPDEKLEKELVALHEIQSGKNSHWKEEGKEAWFAQWHKSVRQCDYILNCYQRQSKKLLSQEEREKIFELNKFFYKNGLSPEDKEKRKQDEKEKFDEYHRLRRIQEEENKEENIGGYLDSLLHSTVYVDKNNELYKVFQRVFFEVELETEKV
jgi:hypothetical protein